MEGSRNNLSLLLFGEAAEVYGVSGYADGEVGVELGVLVRLEKCFAAEYVYVEVVSVSAEVAVKDIREVLYSLIPCLAERLGDDGEGIGNTVHSIAKGHLGN